MKVLPVTALALTVSLLTGGIAAADEIDDVLLALSRSVSGNRARDYTMRLWQYDKWSTLPMWNKTAREAKTIMTERGFDEATVVDTPADGATTFGTWTNPIGWDCKSGTLEIIEPKNIPEEYRILCNYLDNPTSLNNYSCPTPPGGVEAEVVLIERNDPKLLASLDLKGKILLVSSGSRGMKKYLDPNGALGIISDEIESANADFINDNQWLNGWSDRPGGWQMNASDSRNNFGFSVSQKKGAFLRDMLREGITVKVRAKIDSRYFTDGSLPYVVGSIKGSDSAGEDVIVMSHIYEWGANDDCAGASIDLEALGTLNDLIESGVLKRPKRTIRMWLGFECYGSMAYTIHNLERMRTKTLAVLCCDSPAENYDLAISSLVISSNFNACPSFTDAVFPEVVGRYYSKYSIKFWKQQGFMSGLDNYFGDPLIGTPINAMYMGNGSHHHHNSRDTIATVDPRTLKEESMLVASYLYYLANADREDVPFIADLAFDKGIEIITNKAAEARQTVLDASDGTSLGEALAKGERLIGYYTGLQKDALATVARIVGQNEKADVAGYLASYMKRLDAFGALMTDQLRDCAAQKAKAASIAIVKYEAPDGDWEKKAATLIPKRHIVGTMTLEQIPVDQWEVVTGSARWWSADSWAAASYFWCDGKRSVKDIKELVELEAGMPIVNFDLVKYFTFLEKHGMIEFVE